MSGQKNTQIPGMSIQEKTKGNGDNDPSKGNVKDIVTMFKSCQL